MFLKTALSVKKEKKTMNLNMELQVSEEKKKDKKTSLYKKGKINYIVINLRMKYKVSIENNEKLVK